ncbi:unnamed protein product [Polarella glacialis]|uniref:Uncharacterized protein n=1 Tax=Polarella glacialis TaxID=89957 RepID=A0A813LEY5_POLGL|nr:unnamed protein product [Polarella glacialis]
MNRRAAAHAEASKAEREREAGLSCAVQHELRVIRMGGGAVQGQIPLPMAFFRAAESAARETELKKQEKALRKQEKERAESQSAWLKQKGQQNKAAARQGGRPDVDENGESWQNFMEQQDSRKAERERLEQEMDHHEELREKLNKERAAAGGVSPEIASPGRITGPGGACSFAPEARSFDGEGLTIRQQLQQAAAQQNGLVIDMDAFTKARA